MVSQGVRLLAIITCIVGWIGVIIACVLPRWSITAFIGTNIVTAQLSWEGLWKACEVTLTGKMRCTGYDNFLDISNDRDTMSGLILLSIIIGFFGIIVSAIGGLCNRYITNERAKSIACIVAGVVFIISAVLCFAPVSWAAYSIFTDYTNPILVYALRRQLGSCLYIGWGAAGLLLLGGVLLCINCPPKEHIYNEHISSARITPISREEPIYANTPAHF